jgi:ubiquinone biosynthesis protein UbiJ
MTQSPGSFLDQLFARVGNAVQPPAWLIHELQHRVVLLLNHVLQQEPEAMARLKRQSGRLVEAHWRQFSMRLVATPAGLLDLGPSTQVPDLTLTLAEGSPVSLAQAALRGDKPAVRIAGDVQLAAEVQWLVDHVRWDIEEDLARIFGDAPAHAVGEVLRRMGEAVRQFAGRGRDAAPADTPGAPVAPSTPAASSAPAAPAAPGQAGG